MKKRDFWPGFAAGGLLPLLRTGSLPDAFPILSEGLEILTSPGVILSLPLQNLVASPWWAIAVIGAMNAAFYGFAVGLLARPAHEAGRRLVPGRRRGS